MSDTNDENVTEEPRSDPIVPTDPKPVEQEVVPTEPTVTDPDPHV